MFTSSDELMHHYCELQDGTPYCIYNQNPIDLGIVISNIKQGGMLNGSRS